MRFIFTTVVMFVVWLGVSSARAEFYNGHKLARDLDAYFTPPERADSDVMYHSGIAIGYLYGICDTWDAQGKQPLPAGVDGLEVAGVVRRYLRAHSDRLNLPASRLVGDALKEKYGTLRE
jgi:hypothetical protein